MKKNLPTYEFIIDDSEESGVKAISIVADPAFKSKLIAFAAIKSTFVALPEVKGKKRKVCGLALIPNTPVYRIDELTGEEYYGFFSAETIEKIVEKFHAENNNNNLNLNHNENQYVDAVLIEDFIVDSKARVEDLKEKGITHENIMGSWCTTYKIMNPDIFEAVLNGGSKVGFSVEAYLDKIMVKMSETINKNNLKLEMKKNNKTLLEKIMKIFASENFERALVPELAITIEWGAPGEVVNQVNTDENGVETLSPIGPGEFATDMGTVVVDDSSNLVEVRPVPEEQPTEVVESETEEMKAYPWEQCISDQLKAGYSQEVADKICGWIKANNSSQEMVTDEVLKTILTEDEYLACKKKKDLDDVDSISLKEDELQDPVMEPDMMPTEETSPSPDVKSKTIGDLVGASDGEYYIKVIVENGVITEAEVSSETNLLKQKMSDLEKENKELQEKLKEPISEPQLQPEIEKKDWSKMSTYEKVMYKRRLEA